MSLLLLFRSGGGSPGTGTVGKSSSLVVVLAGHSSSGVLSFTGMSASNIGAEVWLSINPAGDQLLIDASGNYLIVQAGGGLSFTGATASKIV